MPSVPPAVSITLPEAKEIAVPCTVKFPPKVNKPLPVVMGRLLAVLIFKVEAVFKSITGFVPVKFMLLASVVVLVTVRFAMVVVASVETLLTLSAPTIIWLPVVVALPVTVN